MKGHNWGLCRKCGKDHGLHPRLGKPRSEESKKKMSESMKGIPTWNKGLTKETDERVMNYSQHRLGHTTSEETKKKISSSRTGQRHKESTKEKISKSLLGNTRTKGKRIHKREWLLELSERMKGNTFAKGNVAWNKGLPTVGVGRGIGGKRPDLNNQYFRSAWEANVARILNLQKREWSFETTVIFDKEGRRYALDFTLPKENICIEVFGYLDERHKRLIDEAKRQKINLVCIDPKEYRELTLEYKDKILFWETEKCNIRQLFEEENRDVA